MKKFHCPVCKAPVTWEGNIYRPFCSERCKLTDLGTWADEGYRIKVTGDGDDNQVIGNGDDDLG